MLLIGFVMDQINRCCRTELLTGRTNCRRIETALVLCHCFYRQRVLCAGPVVEKPL